jgi:hypothetical protein
VQNVASARRYKRMVDTPGTGNVTELSRDDGPYRDIRFDGKLYTSGMSGTAVWNVQVQPVGPVPLATLNKILAESRQ